LEAQNKELQMFFKPQKQRNKAKKQEEKEWYFVSKLLLFSTTISCSFLIHFERSQRLQICYLKIYNFFKNIKYKKQ
jgi:hypothetical protein